MHLDVINPVAAIKILSTQFCGKLVYLFCDNRTAVDIPMLPILHISHHPADMVAPFTEMLLASPTTSPNQPLLTFTTKTDITTMTVKILSQALSIMLQALKLDNSLYSLRSLRRRGHHCLQAGGPANGHKEAQPLGLGHFLDLCNISMRVSVANCSSVGRMFVYKCIGTPLPPHICLIGPQTGLKRHMSHSNCNTHVTITM